MSTYFVNKSFTVGTSNLLCDGFGFNQTSKSVDNFHVKKLQNPKKLNKRSDVQ